MALIETTEDIVRLDAIVSSWEGTPYAPNGAVKGKDGGVSCQKLPSEILREFGSQAPLAPDRGTLSIRQIPKIMEEWLNSNSEYFLRVEDHSDIRPGDVLFSIFDGVRGHLALAVDKHSLVHVWMAREVHRTTTQSRGTRDVLRGIWRPLK